MQEHKQIQLYVGLEEGGCVDVGAIKLEGFALIASSELEALKRQNAALVAELEALKADNERLKALAVARDAKVGVAHYQCREIGESDWQDCDKGWFEYCTNSPLHDTRIIHDRYAERVKDGQA